MFFYFCFLVEVFMEEVAFDLSLWVSEILVLYRKKETIDIRERRNSLSKSKGIKVNCEFRRWQIEQLE